jgi:hypothetical protein
MDMTDNYEIAKALYAIANQMRYANYLKGCELANIQPSKEMPDVDEPAD